jgi:hypothetical protein
MRAIREGGYPAFRNPSICMHPSRFKYLPFHGYVAAPIDPMPMILPLFTVNEKGSFRHGRLRFQRRHFN